MLDSDPRGVRIGRQEGAATFSDALVCGIRTCPKCGPKIAIAHRDDIAQVVANARDRGVTVRFLTLTIRHGREDALADSLDVLLACFRGLTKGRQWMDIRRDYGLIGMVRVVECKYSHASGWHPHLHVLLFLRPQEKPGRGIADLFYELLIRWLRLTSAAGYSADAQAQDMREVSDEHLDVIAGYITKEAGDRIALEMTGQDFKSSKHSVSPRGLLVVAARGDDHAAVLWREYESATRSRRLYAGATGVLRAALAALPEPVEKEAAKEPAAAAVREQLAVVSRPGWQHLSRVRGFRAQLASVAVDAESGWDVAWWLRDRGITAAVADLLNPAVDAVEDRCPIPDDVEAVY